MPNVQRAALVNLGDLTAYDQAKTFLVVNGFDPDSKVFFYTRSNKNSILQDFSTNSSVYSIDAVFDP